MLHHNLATEVHTVLSGPSRRWYVQKETNGFTSLFWFWNVFGKLPMGYCTNLKVQIDKLWPQTVLEAVQRWHFNNVFV